MSELITASWLKVIGFKWHQLERQPEKHWVLWLGGALGCNSSFEDLGVELAYSHDRFKPAESFWFCWLRSDAAGRYHRFIHIRYLKERTELISLIEGMTGQKWDTSNHLFGNLYTPYQAAQFREEDARRLDRRIMREGAPWYEVEKDDSIGRPLIEHLEAHEKAKNT